MGVFFLNTVYNITSCCDLLGRCSLISERLDGALEPQTARLGQRPTLSTQGPIRLRHACQVTAQRGAAASQAAGLGLLPTVAKVSAYTCTFFMKNVITFVTTTPSSDIKPSSAHVLHMVGTRLRAKFRRRMTRRSGGDRSQTK